MPKMASLIMNLTAIGVTDAVMKQFHNVLLSRNGTLFNGFIHVAVDECYFTRFGIRLVEN